MKWLPLFLFFFFTCSLSQFIPLPFLTPTVFTCKNASLPHSNITFEIPVPTNVGTFVVHFFNLSRMIFTELSVTASLSPDLSSNYSWNMIYDSSALLFSEAWLGPEVWIDWKEAETQIYVVVDCTRADSYIPPSMTVEVVVPKPFPLQEYGNRYTYSYSTVYMDDVYHHSHWFYVPYIFSYSQQIFWAESCGNTSEHGNIIIRSVSRFDDCNIEDSSYLEQYEVAVGKQAQINNAYNVIPDLNYWNDAAGTLRVITQGQLGYFYVGTDSLLPIQAYLIVTSSYGEAPEPYVAFFNGFLNLQATKVEDDLVISKSEANFRNIPDISLLKLYYSPNYYEEDYLHSVCYVSKYGQMFNGSILNISDSFIYLMSAIKAEGFFKNPLLNNEDIQIVLVYNDSLVIFSTSYVQNINVELPKPDLTYLYILYGISGFAGISLAINLIFAIKFYRNRQRVNYRNIQ